MECQQTTGFGERIQELDSQGDELRRKKNFKCCYCHKLLSSKQNLKEHLFSHTGELPYVCRVSGCGIRFRHGSVLSSHKKIHYVIDKILSQHYRDKKEKFEVKASEEEKKNVLLPPIGRVQDYFIKASQSGI